MVRFLFILWISLALCWLLSPSHLTSALSQTSAQPPRQAAAEQLRQAATLFDAGKYLEAAATARQACELNPQLLPAWKLAGIALQLAGQPAAALVEFNGALQRFPADAELWLSLARVQYQQSALQSAEQSVRQSLKLQPEYADANAQLGLILEAALDYPKALEAYQRAIALYRQQGREKALPLYQAATLLNKMGQARAALELLTRAQTLEPRVSELRVARGRTLEQLARVPEAIAEYRQAVALDGNTAARSHLERLQAGAIQNTSKPGPQAAAFTPAPIRFRNSAATAKLNFTLRNAATIHKYLVEPMTGGVAAFDYNNDGHTDIYFVNGAELPTLRKTAPAYWNRLFRNNGDATFTDVTAQAGVAGAGYAMGVAVADYDNDGDQDLFVTGVQKYTLFRNEGNGRFTDVTEHARLTASEQLWSVSAAWLDYDNDGHLDLFVVNYVHWQAGRDPVCGDPGRKLRTYCLPDHYPGRPNQLFHNNGNGTFTDVSQQTGIAAHIGKGMGVSIADYNQDGWMDVFVANDTQPNFLFKNNGGKGFAEVALTAGVALNDGGKPVSSMGVDFRDYDNDGWSDVIVSTLEGETFPLFRNAGQGFFYDETWPSGLGTTTIRRSGWGLGFFDFNRDGYKDLFTVNAHVNDLIEQFSGQSYRQPLSVFANTGKGQFSDISKTAGEGLLQPQARRGCAFADFNHDGRVDVVTTSLNEPAELWLNESAPMHHWLMLQLIGKRSNRDGIGARVKIVTAADHVQFNHATSSVGYASSSAGPMYFGLGAETKVKLLEIHWPSGIVQRLNDVAVDRVVTIHEAIP
jgi:enediyne biosynthesis protein E4